MKRPDITPGPWEERDNGLVYSAEGEFICDTAPPFEGVGPSQAANARAIAALPDLLDALEAIVACDDDIPAWSDLIENAQAALTKAGYQF